MSLDPKTNRQEREAEKAKQQQDPPLNPPFPHLRESFDPFFFNLDWPSTDLTKETLRGP